MTNLEKLREGSDEEIEKLMISFAYRSDSYSRHARQVKEWLNEEVNTNYKGEVVI